MRQWLAMVMSALAVLSVPAAAQPQIPLDYSDANTIKRADPDKSAALRAREEAAANAAETACAARDAAGCGALGKAYFHGEGKPQNRPVAEIYLRRACDAADPEGCLWLGTLFVSVGKPEPAEMGIAALERGCRLGSLEACNSAADAIENRTPARPDDQAVATRLRRDACAKGGASACNALGMALVGSDDPAQRDEGMALLERQCRSGNGEACSLVISPLRQTIPPRTDLAREIAELGCRAGVPYLCRELGEMLFAEAAGPPESRTAALSQFDRACALDSLFCTLPGQIRARPALEESCKRGVQADCVALGRIYSLDSNSPLYSPAEAIKLLGTACETGALEGCSAAALMITDGGGQITPEDAAQMMRWHDIGCTGGSTPDCKQLAQLLLKGDPFPSDRERGYALLGQLCEGGESDVCATLDEIALDDPDAPLFVADSRFVPPLSEEEAEQRKQEVEKSRAEGAALRERACTSTSVTIDGLVYHDRICSSVVRVLRGFAARPGEAPWQALIWRPEKLGNLALTPAQRVLCGGSVIRQGWILTAAHCLTDEGGVSIATAGHRVRLGLNNPLSEEGFSYPIIRAIPHPDFKLKILAFDIALVQYDPARGTRGSSTTIAPRQIRLDPMPLEARRLEALDRVTTYGWGVTKVGTGLVPDHLRGARLRLRDAATCTNITKFTDDRRNSVVCADDTRLSEGGQACSGDSGGPLISFGGADPVPTVIGVVSGGVACGTAGKPSRYIRVAHPLVQKWLRETLPPAGARQTPARSR